MSCFAGRVFRDVLGSKLGVLLCRAFVLSLFGVNIRDFVVQGRGVETLRGRAELFCCAQRGVGGGQRSSGFAEPGEVFQVISGPDSVVPFCGAIMLPRPLAP